MELKASIDYKEFAEEFNKFPIEAAKEMRIELSKAARTIASDAKLHHRFKTKSGMLERAIKYIVSKSGLSAQIYIDDGIAKYGKYVHEGTDAHQIRPKTKKALYFVKNSTKFFSKKGVNHPGTKPDKFLYEAADRQQPYFLARMNGAMKRIIEAFK